MIPGAFRLPYYLALFVGVPDFSEDVRCGNDYKKKHKHVTVMRPIAVFAT